jgi:hypothetical protein
VLCFPAIREISRGRYQGAPFGVPSPLKEGEINQKPNSRGGAGTKRRGCLKFEFDDLYASCPGRDAAFFTLLRRTGTPVEVEKSWTPAQQRTALQELRAALRPGNAETDSASYAGLTRVSINLHKSLAKMMDCRAFAAPKGLRPRRRVKSGNDAACVIHSAAAAMP